MARGVQDAGQLGGLVLEVGMNTPRPMARVRIEGVRVSSTRSIAIEVDRYEDVTLADRMRQRGQITDRQHLAALRLYGLFLAAGLLPRSTGRIDSLPGGEEPLEDGEEGEPLEDARIAYRRLLREAGSHWGGVLDTLCHGDKPEPLAWWWVTACKAGLDWLGDEWGLERAP
jgi:hypothetical protein